MLEKIRKNKISLILIAIILLGIFLRFYKLDAMAFDRDEFFELNSSYGYFKTGNFVAWDFGLEKPFPTNAQDDSSNERAEIFRWQLAQLYHFAEPSEALVRGLGAAWGVIAILLIYFVTASLTGNVYIGLIAAFLTAIGQSEIIYSRRLRMYAMFFPAYLLFSWTVFKFYESKYRGKLQLFKKISEKIGFNFTYFIPALIAGLISYNTHMLTAHIVATVAAYSAFWLFIKLKKDTALKNIYSNKYFITIFAAMIGFIVYQLPIFDQLHKLINKNFRFFLRKPHYDFFYQYFADFKYEIFGVILVIFGTWFLAKKMNKNREAAFLFFSIVVPLLFAIFTWRRDVSQRYIYFIQSFGIILSAVGIYGVIQFVIRQASRQVYKKIATVGLLIFFVLIIDIDYIFSKKSAVYTQGSYYPDFRKVFDYVIKNRQPEDVMITRTYRSFYWRGENIKTYDLKSLGFGSGGCEKKIEKIIQENPSGWAIYPKIDALVLCESGRRYYENNLEIIKDESIPYSTAVYRWGK